MVDATIQEFPDGTPTAEAAAREIGCGTDEIVKTLVFVTERGFVLALVPGDRRADEALVAEAAGAAEIRVATPAEVLEATGYEVGAVAPFPLPRVQEVLMERTLLQHSKVWFGAGTPAHLAALAPGELQRITGARTEDLVG